MCISAIGYHWKLSDVLKW